MCCSLLSELPRTEGKPFLFQYLQHPLLTKPNIALAAKGKRFKGPNSSFEEQAMNCQFGAKSNH